MMANEQELARGLHAEVKKICLRRGGLEACRKIAKHVETEVQDLANAINREPALADHVAVIFVGSSARGEMCLHSDVDYLVLLDGEGRKGEAKKLKDAIEDGLKHNELATNSECLGEEPASAFLERAEVNFLFRLELYDISFVWGNKELFEQFAKDVANLLAKKASDTLIEMLFIYRRFRRSARFDAPWPDLKSGRGGVRDLQFIIQVAKIKGAPRESGIEECIQFLCTMQPKQRVLIEASNCVFRVRNLLHGQPERRDDILDKRGLRFICDGSTESPFQLMSEYRRQAEVIYTFVVALKKGMRQKIDESYEKTIQSGWTQRFKDAESSKTSENEQIALSNEHEVLRLAVAWNSKSPKVLEEVMKLEKDRRDWSVLYALAYNLYSPLEVYAFLLGLAQYGEVYRFIVREAVRNPMVELVEEGAGSDKAEVDIRGKMEKARRYLAKDRDDPSWPRPLSGRMC